MDNARGALLRVEGLELAFGGSPDDARIFNSLIVKEEAQARGGLGVIFRAEAMDGRIVAVKKMLLPDRALFGSEESWRQECERRETAFREEYITLCRLAVFKGFMKVYGYCRVDGAPTILMEWVIGASLAKVADLPAFASLTGPMRTLAVARIGRDLFHLLARLEAQTEQFVHRDISPANVMVRLSERTFDRQVAEGTFDLCFIDFGSASVMREGDGTFTTSTSILRGATPEFAAPEMLTNDLPGLVELRKSSKIDVYAACSVIYWLLCGRTPYALSERKGSNVGSDYLYKMTNEPLPCGFAPNSVEALLGDIVLRGIRPTQDARASAYALYKALDFYVMHFEENLARSASGNVMTMLDMRGIDAPDLVAGQIDLSNPLAGQMLSSSQIAPPAATPPPAQYGTPGASYMPTASPAVGNAAPRRASGRMKPVAIAAVVVVVAVVAALFVFMRNGADTGEGQDAGAGQSTEQNIPGLGNPSDADADQGEGGGSAGSASAGTAKSDGLEGDWVGTLTATSHDYACYGAEKYPFSMTIRDVSEAGHATLDTTVLLHAHDRSQLKSDIDSSELDVPVEFKGLVATLEGNRLYAEYSDESKLGVNALIAITIEWEGEITDPENVRVAVVSKYGPSNTEDDYSLSRA